MIDKKQRIINLLLEFPQGLKAREISDKLLYMDRHEVNHILYSNPNVFTAVNYVWRVSDKKAKILTNENEYKKEEIDCLCRIYHTPFFETQKLADLDLPTFKMAVEHAKELYNRDQLSYSLTGRWYSIVTMSEKTFRETVNQLIAQQKAESEKRVAQLIERRKKEKQENQQKFEQRKLMSIANKNSQIYKAQKQALVEDQTPVRRCAGNCSTCTRDECIENK